MLATHQTLVMVEYQTGNSAHSTQADGVTVRVLVLLSAGTSDGTA